MVAAELVKETVQTVTGGLAADALRGPMARIRASSMGRAIERRLNPEQVHPKVQEILAEALTEALRGLPAEAQAQTLALLRRPANRRLLLDWVLHWQNEAPPEAWNLDATPASDVARAVLERLPHVLHATKTKHFPPEAVNLLDGIERMEARLHDAIRATASRSGRTTLVAPPEVLVNHRFGLPPHFRGRAVERRGLTEWYLAPEGPRPVMVLEAIGGMGKSSLAWLWTQADVLDAPVTGAPDDEPAAEAARVPPRDRPEGVLWWSYYEGEGTFRGFLEAAIGYVSRGVLLPEDYRGSTGGESMMDYPALQRDLLTLLSRERHLLVWDGAERLLVEYGGVDAALREERLPDEVAPERRDFLERLCMEFVRAMAAQTTSRLLLTTRLHPRPLERAAGSMRLELKGLEPREAASFLRAQGIRGTEAELRAAAARYEQHPLCLANLAAALKEDFEQRGDVAAAPQYDVTWDLRARRHHVLERAYERRAPHLREMLSRLAACRGAIPRDVVRLLVGDLPGVDRRALGRDLNELVSHGLLRRVEDEALDFHPVVRRYCYGRLAGKERIHRRLALHFVRIPPPATAQRLQDLAPSIEAFHHMVQADVLDVALLHFERELEGPLIYFCGAYRLAIDLLEPVLARPSLKLLSDNQHGYAYNVLGTASFMAGDWRRSVAMAERAYEVAAPFGAEFILRMNRRRLMLSIGMAMVMGGRLAPARKWLLNAGLEAAFWGPKATVADVEDGWKAANEDALVLILEGRWEEARRRLASPLGIDPDSLAASQIRQYAHTYAALLAVREGDPDGSLRQVAEARRHWAANALQRDMALIDMVEAEARLAEARRTPEPARKDAHARAGFLLERAAEVFRRIGSEDLSAAVLVLQAQRSHHAGDARYARAAAEETLEMADRGEMRLLQADAHLLLAELDLRAGDREGARRHAEAARERAWCDGPPHCYRKALERAEALLREL